MSHTSQEILRTGRTAQKMFMCVCDCDRMGQHTNKNLEKSEQKKATKRNNVHQQHRNTKPLYWKDQKICTTCVIASFLFPWWTRLKHSRQTVVKCLHMLQLRAMLNGHHSIDAINHWCDHLMRYRYPFNIFSISPRLTLFFRLAESNYRSRLMICLSSSVRPNWMVLALSWCSLVLKMASFCTHKISTRCAKFSPLIYSLLWLWLRSSLSKL